VGQIDIPQTVPVIYHDELGLDWMTEEVWIKRFGVKYGDIRHNIELTDYVRGDGTTFIIFFTTQFPTGEHKETPQLMAAVCNQKSGLGHHIEINSIIRYGTGVGINKDEDIKRVLKDTVDLQLIERYRVPCGFAGNIKDYDALLVKIYNLMWGKKL
tara:strand:+ start:457 stop:924 length:468 start_codon:yes stop_codon:yes gene_type:complete